MIKADDFTNKGCLLIAQLSCKDNLIDEDYVKGLLIIFNFLNHDLFWILKNLETVKLAEDHSDFVIGFICQNKISENPALLHIAPGKHAHNDYLFWK